VVEAGLCLAGSLQAELRPIVQKTTGTKFNAVARRGGQTIGDAPVRGKLG
jgi:hypothetical protein